MEYGLIGRTLKHSFSKTIHEMLAPYSYELKELEPESVGAFLQAKNFRALNVTIPYKQMVIPYLDEISEGAKNIGAVNTIVNRNGKLYGDNTDFYGMCDLIEHIGVEVKGKKALILGTGGTSKTAEAVLTSLGAKEIIKVSRKEGDGAVSYENAIKNHCDAEIIVNTTPLGTYPEVKGVAIDLKHFPNLQGVADAVYNPLRSQLVLDAQSLGIKAESGLYMLVAQAVYASEKFLDVKYEKGTVDRIFEEVKNEKRNIVLIGMPGCGKSTVGKALAKYGYQFVDTDHLIEEREGKTCAQIINEKGIVYFRKVESEVINGLVFDNGKVIATGGGAVLDKNNVINLKRNGYLYYLNANLERLIVTDDRPLSNNREKLIALYNERKDIYELSADEIIPDGTVEEVVTKILRIDSKTEAKISPSLLCGAVVAPPSKSMAHRLIIGAGLSKGIAEITNVSLSEDIKATLDCMVALGVKVEKNGNAITIDGREFLKVKSNVLNCNESGSTIRFFIPLALTTDKEITLKGAKRLLERPLTVYQTLALENGFTFEKSQDRVRVKGKLTPDSYVVDGSVSSQFITGLIFALSTLDKESKIIIEPPFESRSYVNLTLRALNLYGLSVRFESEYVIVIDGKRALSGDEQTTTMQVEGDYSNSAFLSAFNYLGGSVQVDGLDEESAQGDKIYIEYFDKLNAGYCTLDIADCPDLAPILMTMAVLKNGAHLTNTARLKIKESDRGVVMAEELKKVGANITVGDNDIYIDKAPLSYPTDKFYGHNDHRIVMSLAVLCSVLGGEIKGIGAVKKSYPDFFNKMIDLGMKVKLC